ncbi:MAG: 5-(carboxyamino)imidazole ribonucleotide synthase [Chitinophagales bacterium]
MKKIGILGGGQLGRMMLQAAANYPCTTYVLEKSTDAPAAHLCDVFVTGDIRVYDDVLAFGRSVDVLTIEIEHVNIEALKVLEAEGKRVIPSVAVLETIADKGLQKEFYQAHGIATSAFVLTENRQDVAQYEKRLPAVHKLCKGGYDGKGVQMVNSASDFEKAFDAPAVLEDKVEVEKEVAVLVARDATGNTVAYPPVEMIFDPVYNLVDYLVSPANLSEAEQESAVALAHQVVEAFQSPGLFAIELLMDKGGKFWVNETAPRVHNSGHHSIEGNYCSQFDMLIRLLLEWPMGNTDMTEPALMANIIGPEGLSGNVKLEGLQEVLSLQGVYLHWYGKHDTKPGRKLGHLTILGETTRSIALLKSIRKVLRISGI